VRPAVGDARLADGVRPEAGITHACSVLIIAIDIADVGAAPDAEVSLVVIRRGFQLSAIEPHNIAAEPDVIAQLAPWQRMVAVSDAQKAAEAQDCVVGMAGLLIEKNIIDATEPLAVRIVDRRAVDLRCRDQRAAASAASSRKWWGSELSATRD
jgi:hypothetical protein